MNQDKMMEHQTQNKVPTAEKPKVTHCQESVDQKHESFPTFSTKLNAAKITLDAIKMAEDEE